MNDEIKEITKVDKQLLDKIEHILASELNCEEYDKFYNYFNEIKKPNILIDIKDDKNIKDYITNLQQENDNLKNIVSSVKEDFLNANNELTNLEQENERLKKMNMHEHKYGSDMEGKYLIEKTKNDRAVEYLANEFNVEKICRQQLSLIKCKNKLEDILNGRSDE